MGDDALELIEGLPAGDRFGPRFQGFQELMRIRIRDVLLVSSLYDLYVFEEDGRLYELIREEYKDLNLSHAPELTRVSSGREALEMAAEERRFDLIITTPHIEDMHSSTFAKMVRDSDLNIPIVLLGYDNRSMSNMLNSVYTKLFDRVFVWKGDFRILITIIKHLEDHLNLEHDTRTVGVQSIILIEDSVRYYSSYLPLIYSVLFRQSRRLISEGINLSDRYLRMRARPKILLCTNYDDAWYYYEKFRENLLGIISDIDFMCNGVQDPQAGIKFTRNVKKLDPDMPILLQSKRPRNEQKAHEAGASFLLKDSPTLLNDLRQFMIDNFSFGDFVFRMPNGDETGRAGTLLELEKMLSKVPPESILYHAERHHFSNWLKARTEFWLADRFRGTNAADFDDVKDLIKVLSSSLREYRRARQRGPITEFNKDSFDPNHTLARIGGGALGGKARGLSFTNLLINNYQIYNRYKGIRVHVPPAVVLATDVFDFFLVENHLRKMALSSKNDAEIVRRFIKAEKFPPGVKQSLREFLHMIKEPLAVRSSSLLEDSQYHPFAGIYDTFMLPNSNPDIEVRLSQLLDAIKCVYASTFYQHTKDYIKITSYRLEEEKMAVVVQKMVGKNYSGRFYPQFSGVAKSHNFYPVAPQEARDGIVSVALGLGQTVVEGGKTVKFAPKYPNHIQQFSTIDDTLKNSQQDFFAINLEAGMDSTLDSYSKLVQSYRLKDAEKDGSLYVAGSTYSHENHAIYDGLSRPGHRIVTFAPVLKNNIFPLPEIARLLLEVGRKEMGTPVEIEFAVNMEPPAGEPKTFGVLQMRPLVINREVEQLTIEEKENSRLICRSNRVLGNGIIDEIHDIVVVDYDHFERSRSIDVAREVHYFNAALVAQQKPYLLIGVGRWGSLDPWLGIPVRWEQISGARTIVESGLKDIDVMPSQGSHFFHNLTSFMVGYFTVSKNDEVCFVDWPWLQSQTAHEEKEFARHLRFDDPIIIKMNGHNQKGIIFKPGVQEY